MKLSKKIRYGVRALSYLAKHLNNKPISSNEISNEEHISQDFLQSILLELMKKGFLEVTRGPGGGYKLAKTPETISLDQIFKALEVPIDLSDCAQEQDNKCDKIKTCTTQRAWQNLETIINDYLKATTLKDISNT